MKAFRTGFNTMWKHAGAYMRRKGIKRAGQFRRDNQHGGKLWASRRECQMTNRIAGVIVDKLYESGKLSARHLNQVRHSLSYSYYLKTGLAGDNWAEVKAQFRSFDFASLPDSIRPLVATRIPTPQNLKEAFTKPWTPNHEMNLPEFMIAVLAAWDYHIFGLRPNVDIDKVKNSREHDVVSNEKYARTAMVGGKSKLHLNKRGTREWSVYRVCTCKGPHKSPTNRQMRCSKTGIPPKKPSWNTCCPINAMLFAKHHQMGASDRAYRIYPRWTKRGTFGNQNHGDVQGLANRWLALQTGNQPFDRNSGRKTLARWLGYLKIPYYESMHIHGDLEQVWRLSYQDKMDRSNYRVRTQSRDPDVCTKALRELVTWFHDTGEPKPDSEPFWHKIELLHCKFPTNAKHARVQAI
jgi:hypothetical protein